MSRLRAVFSWVGLGLAAGTIASSTKPVDDRTTPSESATASIWSKPLEPLAGQPIPAAQASSLWNWLPSESAMPAGQAEMPALPPLPPMRVPAAWDSLWRGSRQSAVAPLPLPEDSLPSALDKEV